MRADNSRHLIAAASRRGDEARGRVVDVLHQADRDGRGLSITELARAAGESHAYLYSQQDLVAAARELQEKNSGRQAGTPTAQRATTASLLARVEALTARNKKLQEENRQLRRRLETAHGQLRNQAATRGA